MMGREKPKLLFLDIDGVLNSYPVVRKGKRNFICPDNVAHLNAIIKKAGCQIVISSSWRMFYSMDEIKQNLKEAGFKYNKAIIGKTPYTKSGRKDDEILQWLKDMEPQTFNYVVLDDDMYDMRKVSEKAIRVSTNTGLVKEDVAKVVAAFLGKETP